MSTKKYRDANKEQTKEYNKKYREEHPDYHINYRKQNRELFKKKDTSVQRRFSRAKSGAKTRKKEWTLSLEDYTNIIKQSCFYCSGYFDIVTYASGLDRIDSNKGYIIDNVVSCCTTCNRIKGNALSLDETKAVIDLIISIRNKNNGDK